MGKSSSTEEEAPAAASPDAGDRGTFRTRTAGSQADTDAAPDELADTAGSIVTGAPAVPEPEPSAKVVLSDSLGTALPAVSKPEPSAKAREVSAPVV
ncbi:MAG: hypothetical protein KIT31_28065, partial [Deltaproteobacteria bacterium]|nr:hypothetical protein [Deltaproteobacteria bacterium]